MGGVAVVMVVVVCPSDRKCEAREGMLGQRPKPSCHGSVLGPPCETVVEGDGGRWCGGAYEVLVVMCLSDWKHQAGGRVLGQKPKTKPLGYDFGHAFKNSGGEWWEKMVGWCV